jgi:hypothetical protein
MDDLKQRLDEIHDDLAERYPEYEEALDLYQAYIHHEFKLMKEQFDHKGLAKAIEKAQRELKKLNN